MKSMLQNLISFSQTVLLISVLGNTLVCEAQNNEGILILTIQDIESNEVTPARIEVIDSSGASYIAEDALLVGGDCYNFDVFDDTLKSALAPLNQVVKEPFIETNQFYSKGESTLKIPEGSVQIKVFKGPEYKLSVENVRILPNETVRKTIKLSRLDNMPAKGWYSSDDHLHIARPVKNIDPYVSKMMQGEDIHVANLLMMGQADHFKVAPQYAHGPKSYYREGDYILAAGQENPRTHLLGHSITLGAKEALNNPDQYLIYRLLWEEAVKQGAINGYAHFGDGAGIGKALGLPVLLPYAHELAHFLEVMSLNQLSYDMWYDILNMGFRIAPTAGTDYPCGVRPPMLPGHERFYTKINGPFTYENWLQGIREGRTFVTTGPLLEFSINGKEIGDEIILDNANLITIEGRAIFDPKKDQVFGLDVIENGRVIGTFPRVNGSGEIKFKLKYPVKQTSWFAVRTMESGVKHIRAHNSTAHSAPIYVTLRNSPSLIDNPRVKAIAREWLAMLEALEIRLNGENIDYLAQLETIYDPVPRKILLNNKSSLLKEIRKAKVFFARMID